MIKLVFPLHCRSCIPIPHSTAWRSDSSWRKPSMVGHFEQTAITVYSVINHFGEVKGIHRASIMAAIAVFIR